MAGSEVTLHGRFGVTPEASDARIRGGCLLGSSAPIASGDFGARMWPSSAAPRSPMYVGVGLNCTRFDDSLHTLATPDLLLQPAAGVYNAISSDRWRIGQSLLRAQMSPVVLIEVCSIRH